MDDSLLTNSQNISQVIIDTINQIFSNLFSSIDNSMYGNLDNLAFINTDILHDSFLKKYLVQTLQMVCFLLQILF